MKTRRMTIMSRYTLRGYEIDIIVPIVGNDATVIECQRFLSKKLLHMGWCVESSPISSWGTVLGGMSVRVVAVAVIIPYKRSKSRKEFLSGKKFHNKVIRSFFARGIKPLWVHNSKFSYENLPDNVCKTLGIIKSRD